LNSISTIDLFYYSRLTGDPDFQKFWEDLSEEGRDWRIQVVGLSKYISIIPDD